MSVLLAVAAGSWRIGGGGAFFPVMNRARFGFVTVAMGISSCDGHDVETHGDAATAQDAGSLVDAGRRVDADTGSDGASEVVCDGDRWVSSAEMFAAVADCTTITGNLSVTGGLTSVEFSRLRVVGGFLTVWGNTALREARFPVLLRTGSFLDVSANEVLSVIDFQRFESASLASPRELFDVGIFDNPMLPACQAKAVGDALAARGFQGKMRLTGNSGQCPP